MLLLNQFHYYFILDTINNELEVLKMYCFDEPIERKGTDSVKWDHTALMADDLSPKTIPLWIADMDFQCPTPIIEALHARVDHKIFGYTSYHNDDYMTSIVNWMQKRFDWIIDRQCIFLTQGVVEAIDLIIKLYTHSGEGIIIQEPVYYPFKEKIIGNNRVVINNNLICDNGKYYMDIEDLRQRAENPKTTMMILCSPHNPVGRVWSKAELQDVITICHKNNVLLVSDEVHFDIVRKNMTHTTLGSLDHHSKIIVCTSPSKSFNLAGMKCSNVIIKHEALQEKWRKTYGEFPTVNPLSMIAAKAAYEHCEDWLDQLNQYIDQNIDFAMQFITQYLPKAKCVRPEGTYLLWIDFTDYERDPILLDEKLRHEAKVLLDPGYLFGEAGRGYQRINLSCPRSLLEDALKRIKNTFCP